ncbi:hypothetical protein [Flavobacterium sp. LS2R12]|uniref:hypothetical protein n=1 Tax=unclassified Flavobacterium TaxID=196869 RepID=UPI003AAB3A6F
MRKLLFLYLLLPVAMLSQDLKNESQQTLSSKVDDFVISFYASHIEVDKMIPFFDTAYFAMLYKFSEHMKLKNEDYGMFVSKKTLKARNSTDGNIVNLTFRIKYKKGSMTEELELRRSSVNSPFKIFYLKTHR